MITIRPQLLADAQSRKSVSVMLLNLKPIRTRIEQVINSLPSKDSKNTEILVTSKTKKIDSANVEITISVRIPSRGPGGGDPPHPPKKAFIWE